MFTILTIGVLSSIAAEIVVKINKSLSGSVLHGKASFLLAAVVALVGAAFKVGFSGVSLTDYHALATAFAQVWTVAQGFFVLVVENLKLDVQEG